MANDDPFGMGNNDKYFKKQSKSWSDDLLDLKKLLRLNKESKDASVQLDELSQSMSRVKEVGKKLDDMATKFGLDLAPTFEKTMDQVSESVKDTSQQIVDSVQSTHEQVHDLDQQAAKKAKKGQTKAHREMLNKQKSWWKRMGSWFFQGRQQEPRSRRHKEHEQGGMFGKLVESAHEKTKDTIRDIVSELKYAVLEFGPWIAVLGSIAAFVGSIVKEMFGLDEATRNWTKSLGTASGAGAKFESQMTSMVRASHLNIDQVRELANAAIDSGMAVTDLADKIPEMIRQTGLAGKMMNLDAHTLMEYNRNLMDSGVHVDQLGSHMDGLYRQMTAMNMSVTEQNDVVNQANEIWQNYTGVLDKSVDAFTKGVAGTKTLFKSLNVDLKNTTDLIGGLLRPKNFRNRMKQAAFAAQMTGASIKDVMIEQQKDPAAFQKRLMRAGVALRGQIGGPDMGGDATKMSTSQLMGQAGIEGGLENFFEGKLGLNEKQFDLQTSMIRKAFPKGLGNKNPLLTDKQTDALSTDELTKNARQVGTVKQGEEALAGNKLELFERLGQEISLKVHDIAGGINTWLQPFVEQATHWLEHGWTELEKSIGEFSTNLWTQFKPTFDTVTGHLGQISKDVSEFVASFKVFETAFGTLFGSDWVEGFKDIKEKFAPESLKDWASGMDSIHEGFAKNKTGGGIHLRDFGDVGKWLESQNNKLDSVWSKKAALEDPHKEAEARQAAWIAANPVKEIRDVLPHRPVLASQDLQELLRQQQQTNQHLADIKKHTDEANSHAQTQTELKKKQLEMHRAQNIKSNDSGSRSIHASKLQNAH